VTEEEAKTKWCPLVRSSAPDDNGASNRWARDPFDGPSNVCIGSACMAWRWADRPDPLEALGFGFCGLAGAPQ
jgi:hypothetical protein